MNITRLVAIDTLNTGNGIKILFEKMYIGDSENFIYEFICDLNDELSLDLTNEEIGKIYVVLNKSKNSNIDIKRESKVKKYGIYINRKVEEI